MSMTRRKSSATSCSASTLPVWMNAVVRGDVHEIRIGAHSNVQDNSVLHGMKQQWGVYLGEYVTVGHSVTLHGCVIEDRCLIGMGSIILNGATHRGRVDHCGRHAHSRKRQSLSPVRYGWDLRANSGGNWKRAKTR